MNHEVVTVRKVKHGSSPYFFNHLGWVAVVILAVYAFGKLLEDMEKSETVYTYNGKHIYL